MNLWATCTAHVHPPHSPICACKPLSRFQWPLRRHSQFYDSLAGRTASGTNIGKEIISQFIQCSLVHWLAIVKWIKGQAVDMFHSLSKAKRLHHVHWACKDFQDGLNEIRMRHYLISKCRANVRLKIVEVDQHETIKSLDRFEKWIQILWQL